MMAKTTNEYILETVRKVEEHLSDIDLDMEKDRQNLQNIDIRLQNVEAQIEGLRKAINQTAERTKNKVQDVVQPIIESTDTLTAQVKKSKMIVLREKVSWFQRLFGELRKEVRKDE